MLGHVADLPDREQRGEREDTDHDRGDGFLATRAECRYPGREQTGEAEDDERHDARRVPEREARRPSR